MNRSRDNRGWLASLVNVNSRPGYRRRYRAKRIEHCWKPKIFVTDCAATWETNGTPNSSCESRRRMTGHVCSIGRNKPGTNSSPNIQIAASTILRSLTSSQDARSSAPRPSSLNVTNGLRHGYAVAPRTVEEIEQNHMVSDKRLGATPLAFGFQNEQWRKLKSQMQDGDVLREFKSPPKTWARMAGRQGIALVRDGKVIDSIVTLLN